MPDFQKKKNLLEASENHHLFKPEGRAKRARGALICELLEKWFPNLVFYYKNQFQKDKVEFWTKKFTLKTKSVKILTSLPQIVSQDIKKSFEGAHWDAKTH